MATYSQTRVALAAQNHYRLDQMNRIARREFERLLIPANGLNQYESAAYVRTIAPGVIDQFGSINAEIAREYYNTVREEAIKALTESRYLTARSDTVAARAAKTLQGKKYVASLPKFDLNAMVDDVVSSGMAGLQRNGFEMFQKESGNALTRAVASYNRDTILYNSALDPAVIGVQRVAGPNACEFCRIVAFDSYGSPRVSSYAPEYHKNCNCSIETLYAGDRPMRPDYYDEYQRQYQEGELKVATKMAGPSGSSWTYLEPQASWPNEMRVARKTYDMLVPTLGKNEAFKVAQKWLAR